MNHRLNINDKCLIYFLTCRKSFTQFVGKIFSKGWNSYKINTSKILRKESCMQQHLFEFFQNLGYDGFIEDTCITLIDKTDPFFLLSTGCSSMQL